MHYDIFPVGGILGGLFLLTYDGGKQQMILALLEGIIMCFVLLIICVVGIANGPVGMVFFYEKEVQDKAIELGLTTRETINKRKGITFVALLIPQFLLVPLVRKTLIGKWVSTVIGFPILAILIAWVVTKL